MAPSLTPLLNALGWGSVDFHDRMLRPVGIVLGFLVTVLFLYALGTNSDQLLALSSGRVLRNSSSLLLCEAWFEEQDRARGHMLAGRDFDTDPVNIYEVGLPEWFVAAQKDLQECDVPCSSIRYSDAQAASITHWDARTDEWPQAPQDIDHSHGFAVLRNAEPPVLFPGLAVDTAHEAGYDTLMTSELASDVPLPYTGIGTTIGDLFALGLPFEKKQKAAMVVISNCGAASFRLQAIEKMQELGIRVDSYGGCAHNKDFPTNDNHPRDEAGNRARYVQKIAIARTYLFYLAFENSQWPDYVTEKFYHTLQAGTVPVVIGAPNIADFAPSPESFLYLESVEDVPAVVGRMKFLMENRAAYKAMLEWKHREASDGFKAIADIPSIHPTCRLCIHIATRLQAQEDNQTRASINQSSVVGNKEKAPYSSKNGRLSTRLPLQLCTCRLSDVSLSSGLRLLQGLTGADEVHRIYVRERGRFRYRPVFLDGGDFSVRALHAAVLRAFLVDSYEPTWVEKRKVLGIVWTTWKVYKVYPVGITIRAALGNGSFTTDSDFREYLRQHPCPKLEAIIV